MNGSRIQKALIAGKEWIELYNPTSQAVNIGGWKLVDSYYGKIVSIPLGTVIMPDGYQLITWTNGSLINSYTTCISLLDSAGRGVDRTSSAKDDKNNNLCWARNPNGKDLDLDLDWKFQAATPGSSNGGSSADIYAGESLQLQFNLTAGCSAPSQAQLSAEMLSSAGKISAPALPLNIRRANLSLSASPDRFDIAKGDEIAWTILLENDGDGTAYGIVVNVTLHQGLQLVEIDSPEECTELELCISCARPDGADHPQGQSGIHPEQLLQRLSSPLGLSPLPGDQPATQS